MQGTSTRKTLAQELRDLIGPIDLGTPGGRTHHKGERLEKALQDVEALERDHAHVKEEFGSLRQLTSTANGALQLLVNGERRLWGILEKGNMIRLENRSNGNGDLPPYEEGDLKGA